MEVPFRFSSHVHSSVDDVEGESHEPAAHPQFRRRRPYFACILLRLPPASGLVLRGIPGAASTPPDEAAFSKGKHT